MAVYKTSVRVESLVRTKINCTRRDTILSRPGSGGRHFPAGRCRQPGSSTYTRLARLPVPS